MGEAYAQRAWNLLIYHWDFPGAEREFRHAIQLDPGASNAHQGYAAYFVAMSRFDEGLEEIRRARDLDPLSLLVNTDYCVDLYPARRFDEALAQCRATLEIDPNYMFALRVTAELYETKGAYPEAHELCRKAWGCDGACIAMIDEVYKAPGAAGGFDAWMETQKDLTGYGWFLAYAYASLGRNDQAFA
jgi:tetratricopeptide (TPR) repeat protein